MEKLSLQELQPLILDWAREKNLLFEENAPKQKLKLIEEYGELASAILKNDIKLQKDAIGDIFVVLVILAEQLKAKIYFLNESDYDDNRIRYVGGDLEEFISDTMCYFYEGRFFNFEALDNLCHILFKHESDLTECANLAWNEIKDRKGKTVNGTFIKN